MLLIASCAPPPTAIMANYPAADPWGHVYPAECRRDLSYVTLPIDYVDRATFNNETVIHPGSRVIGVCLHCTEPLIARILVDKTLNASDAAAVIQHERCHRVEYLLGKSIDWHREGE